MDGYNLEACCKNAEYSVDTVLEEARKIQVHEINQGRSIFSEYHHLFQILKKYNEKFQMYMRMELRTFEYLYSKVHDSLTKNWCNLHQQPIREQKKMVITIRFLATDASYGDLAFHFVMGKSSVSNIIEEVLDVLWNTLWPIHMPVPTEEMFMQIAQDYYLQWDLPHCVGSIDSKHVWIKKPPNSVSRYLNYKKYFSIVLQAVVDAQGRFVAIDTGGYGHQHDATTFRHSSLYRHLKSGKLRLPEADELYKSRTFLQYYFVGDGAYPLSENLMKPYPGHNLSTRYKIFNARLSRARVTVECAFGRLYQKWRIFYTVIQCLPEKVELIVNVACLLINIIIDQERLQPAVSRNLCTESSALLEDKLDCEQMDGNGEAVRMKLIDFFLQNPLL